jgi:hypothetical protein
MRKSSLVPSLYKHSPPLIDNICQYPKIEFAPKRFISLQGVSEQSEPLVGLTSRTSEKAKRKNIEIIRIFKA